jgi:hypothetical protein
MKIVNKTIHSGASQPDLGPYPTGDGLVESAKLLWPGTAVIHDFAAPLRQKNPPSIEPLAKLFACANFSLCRRDTRAVSTLDLVVGFRRPPATGGFARRQCRLIPIYNTCVNTQSTRSDDLNQPENWPSGRSRRPNESLAWDRTPR